MNYFSTKWNSLTFIFATRKLRYDLLAHCLNLVIKSNPLKYMLSRPAFVKTFCSVAFVAELVQYHHSYPHWDSKSNLVWFISSILVWRVCCMKTCSTRRFTLLRTANGHAFDGSSPIKEAWKNSVCSWWSWNTSPPFQRWSWIWSSDHKANLCSTDRNS